MFVLRILRGVAMGVILSITAVVAIITILFWVIAVGAVIVTCSHPFIRAARLITTNTL